MKKDYTLTFTMDDGTTRTVNFSLPVAAANASEISCTGFESKTNVEDCLNWLKNN